MNLTLYPQLVKKIDSLPKAVSEKRKSLLAPLITYLQKKLESREKIRLNFICTHNSRRSHLSQLWAQTMASYFGFDNITCYSAGTEATALNHTVIATLEKSGFQSTQLCSSENPIYSINYGRNELPVIGFSKTIEHRFNPQTDFAAIMTCDSANEACPFVGGADSRIAITYQDPKIYDNTPLETEKYLERSDEIASDMYFVFSQLKSN